MIERDEMAKQEVVRSQVGVEVDHLVDAISCMERLFDDLRLKLDPVLFDSVEPHNLDKEPEKMCMVAAEFRSATHRVEAINDKVQNLIASVQL